MVDFRICQKCQSGTFFPAREYDDEIIINPFVKCAVKDDEVLLMNETPPSSCPYELEHQMSMQDADPEIINSLSGDQEEEENGKISRQCSNDNL